MSVAYGEGEGAKDSCYGACRMALFRYGADIGCSVQRHRNAAGCSVCLRKQKVVGGGSPHQRSAQCALENPGGSSRE